MTFIGGYIAGMAVALLAVAFFSGAKRTNAAYDARLAALERRAATARGPRLVTPLARRLAHRETPAETVEF